MLESWNEFTFNYSLQHICLVIQKVDTLPRVSAQIDQQCNTTLFSASDSIPRIYGFLLIIVIRQTNMKGIILLLLSWISPITFWFDLGSPCLTSDCDICGR